MTRFKDLDVPENYGFLRDQTTPFAKLSGYRYSRYDGNL